MHFCQLNSGLSFKLFKKFAVHVLSGVKYLASHHVFTLRAESPWNLPGGLKETLLAEYVQIS